MQVGLYVKVNKLALLSLSLTSLPTLRIILPLCSWPVSSPDLWSSRSRVLVEINKSHSSQASRYSWDVLCQAKEVTYRKLLHDLHSDGLQQATTKFSNKT
jgi:hypothetical protein